MRLELVRDWMTRDVLTISPDVSLLEAGQMMVDKGIRRLPVVEDGKLAGIVTNSDVRGACAAGAAGVDFWDLTYKLSKLTAADIMTPNPTTVTLDDTIGVAAQKMLEQKIGGLPVVDHGGKLIGILTESDIFRLVAHNWMHTDSKSGEPFAHYE